MSLKPLHQNLLASAATVVYVKTVVIGCNYAVSKDIISTELSRKIVHIAAGTWTLFWPYFDESHPSWRLNIIVPFMYALQLTQAALFGGKDDPLVKTISRTGNPKELLYGPLFFTLVMNYTGLFAFRAPESIYVMSCLGYGDGVAPLIGTWYPYGRYPTYPFDAKSKKSLSGSLGFFLASICGYQIMKSSCRGEPSSMATFLPVAVMSTITEGITGAYDNIAVALIGFLTPKLFP
ncbi:unnamed protein product [Cylindrotheca closterium]|uniref:Dolichol kinase n=1 Tax=Cylindrotheca closterium TaxID=2856 RepID=A0AAD2JK61_9STRA|nr:unnamed protein product [Cylindrotheca closterium]